MFHFCEACGRRENADDMLTLSVVFHNRWDNDSLKADHNWFCQECGKEVLENVDEFFKKIDAFKIMRRHETALRAYIDDMKREEQELDAWKADIHGGDER